MYMYIWGNWTATPSMRLNIPIHEHNIIRAIPNGQLAAATQPT